MNSAREMIINRNGNMYENSNGNMNGNVVRVYDNSGASSEKNRSSGNDFISKVFITLLPPAVLFFLYFNDVILWETFELVLSIYIIIEFILPIVFKFNLSFQRSVVFLNTVNLPRFAQYKHPERHGLIGTRNFYIKTEDGMYLGIWHVLPEALIKDNLTKEEEEEYFEKTLSHGPPVFVYMHGNSSNRCAGHHVELHKVLRKRYHVVTFDYRGYGDSTGIPFSEDLVMNDALTVLKWVKKITTAPVLVWGHSLGTAVATNSLRTLTERNDCFVQGLVLESPFDNMRNEVGEHPLTVIFKNLPWFRYTIVDPIYNSGFLFASDDHINHVNCPILVLHAEDDWVVPFKLGFKLYNNAVKQRNVTQGPIHFERFAKKFGYGHKYICRAPELPNLVKILFSTFKLGAIVFFLIFFVGTLIFKFSYTLQRQVIFLNYVNLPLNPHYKNPEKYGLNGTRNFFITTEDKINLGTWHMLPTNLIRDNLTDKDYERLLANGQPVFIYMHGNSGNRAADHRIELYKLLREHYHVITFDYRGYGDSTSVDPDETGAVTDGSTVIKYVRNQTNSRIYVWGHSLGTAISSHALDVLGKENIQVNGLILESPFNTLRSEISEHPSAYFFKNLPWFTYTIVDAMYHNGFKFETEEHLLHTDCPILILHAEDDLVVPFKLGLKLFSIIAKHRGAKQAPIQMTKFEKKYGYGHKYVCRAPELPKIIEKFVADSIKAD